MTRTITAAVLLSLTLAVLPAAAGNTASTAATIDTLRQAGFASRCLPKPNTVQNGQAITVGRQIVTVGLRQVGNLVVGNMVIGVCTLGPTDASTPSTDGPKLDMVIARHTQSVPNLR